MDCALRYCKVLCSNGTEMSNRGGAASGATAHIMLFDNFFDNF